MASRQLQVLVGPENVRSASEVGGRTAPRIDYRLVADRFQSDVIQWYPAPSGFCGVRPIRLARSFAGNLSKALRFVRSLKPGSIIYSTGETWGLPVALAGVLMRHRGFSHIVYAHRVYSTQWLRFLRGIGGMLAVDGWICVTRHQERLLRSALGKKNVTVAAVSQGIDLDFYERSKACAISRPPYVLVVGTEMRNYDLLFRAVRDLRIPVIVKATSAWMASSRRMATAMPDNVQLITQRLPYTELRNLYAGAALVVTPVYDTPQAAGITTILESMAMGVAVVATRSQGLPDGLTSGDNCLVVEPDPKSLSSAISDLLGDPSTSLSIAARGRRLVADRYRLEQHASQVADFIEHCAAGRIGLAGQ